jgi:putative endonuclease
MAKHNELGQLGEEFAKKHLLQRGYSILEQNWRWGKGELDIIAKQNDILVFLEIKTRTTAQFGYPEESVSQKKQNLMYELAVEYMHQILHETEFRFDVIAITMQPQMEIKHFEDAFFPTW